MMEQMGKIAALCLIGGILAVLLKKNGPEMALLLSLGACCAVLALLGRSIGQVVDLLRSMMAAAELEEELFAPLLKIAAIAIIGRIGTSLCRDAGESALAAALETAAAFSAVLVALPLFYSVWDMLRGLL